MNLISQEYYKETGRQYYPSLINYSNDRGKNVYFIGIGGVGMSAIAKIMIDEGCFVSGSDLESSPVTRNLERLGAKINTRQDGNDINPYTNLVITSAAIGKDNPDLIKAKMLGLKVIKYSEFLGSLMKSRKGIAISGTHGKTTTSAMISTILKKAGHEPTFVIGGDVAEIGGNSYAGKGNFFVAEACEYDRTFLNLSPQVGVITNIDGDHLDYYKDMNGITEAFSDFVSLIPSGGLLVINNDDANIKKAVKNARCRFEDYSVFVEPCKQMVPVFKFISPDRIIDNLTNSSGDRADCELSPKWVAAASPKWVAAASPKWVAVIYYYKKDITRFKVFYERKYYGDFCLKIPGLYNVSNALAAISVCNYVGLNEKIIKEALASFKGVSRRFQNIDSKNGITIIDDYAHHPTAVRSILETVKSIYDSKRLWCIFQPHQHNRTRLLLKEFAMALTLADKVIITDIYAARDSDTDKESVSSLDLAHELLELDGDVKYIKNISDIIDSLRLRVEKDDIVLTMGAGDIWKVAYGLKKSFEK